jgi:hypothetical protein
MTKIPSGFVKTSGGNGEYACSLEFFFERKHEFGSPAEISLMSFS